MKRGDVKLLNLQTKILLTIFVLLSSCSKDENSKKLSQQQTMLVNGYAQMHSTTKSLAWTDKIFLIKFESDKVEEFGKALSKSLKGISTEIEGLQKNAKWIDLKNTGAPEITKLKMDAVTKDRLKSFLPIVGRSKANFERTLLLSNSGVLNQMLHLAQVMIDVEDNEGRKKFLKRSEQIFSDLYKMNIQLLNDHYFCHDTSKESKSFN